MEQYQQLELNNTGYYQIESSTVLVYPIVLTEFTWLKLSTAHTSFTKNQTWSIRVWISTTPDGQSISGLGSATRWISPSKTAQTVGLYDIMNPPAQPLVNQNEPQLSLSLGIATNVTYWVNVKNMENKHNAFYFKLDLITIAS
jgi:hypothetical protein